jgi:HSP20 family protein
MGKWMDQVLGPSFQHYCSTDSWKPAINLCEYDAHYAVVVDLAGVKVGEIDLRAEEGVLTISGDREVPADAQACGEDVRIHLMEIDHGHFQRAVRLPDDADVDAIEAFYRNGYLWIRIPKRPRG